MRPGCRKKEEWQKLIEDCKRSKETKAEYCKKNDINIKVFRNWCYKLGDKRIEIKKAQGEKSDTKQFVGFKLTQVGVKINLPNGISVEVTGQSVAELIKELINVV